MSYNIAHDLLQQGIAAAKAGDKSVARSLLQETTNLAPNNERGWLWLASVAESPEKSINYLQQALKINPANERVKAGLQRLQARVSPPAPPAPQQQAASQVIAAPPKQQAERGVVMIVDDSPTVRKLVAVTLKKHNYQVIPAIDGMEALAKMNDSLPDLILLDITMPRLDGYQLCKIIKGNADTKHIPVVMLSGKDGFFDKVRGRMAGSTEYVTKPFKPQELVKIVNKHIVSKIRD